MICEYGCGREALYQMKNGKWCCSERFTGCTGFKKKLSKSLKGHIGCRKGETKETNDGLKKLSEQLKGRKISEEVKEKMRGRTPWNKGKNWNIFRRNFTKNRIS